MDKSKEEHFSSENDIGNSVALPDGVDCEKMEVPEEDEYIMVDNEPAHTLPELGLIENTGAQRGGNLPAEQRRHGLRSSTSRKVAFEESTSSHPGSVQSAHKSIANPSAESTERRRKSTANRKRSSRSQATQRARKSRANKRRRSWSSYVQAGRKSTANRKRSSRTQAPKRGQKSTANKRRRSRSASVQAGRKSTANRKRSSRSHATQRRATANRKTRSRSAIATQRGRKSIAARKGQSTKRGRRRPT